MLETYASREQRIADLEIHGWTAVKDSKDDPRSFSGIWNEQLQLGFALSRSIAGRRVIRLDASNFAGWGFAPLLCDWGAVTDDVLNAIDARLAET